MRNFCELVEAFRAKPLVTGGPNIISADLPVGEGIIKTVLCLNLALTAGTASGAKTNGELAFVKAITFRTNLNEYLYKNVPGLALWNLNKYLNGTDGIKDAIAATDGTYRVYFDLWFAQPNSLRPFDTILDSSRNKTLELNIELGTTSDLFSSPGTSSVSVTADLLIERIKGTLPAEARPIMIQEVGNIVPVNPASQTYLELERAKDLGYASIMIGTHNSASSGVPFSGTAASNVVSEFSISSNREDIVRGVLARIVNAKNKVDFNLASANTGYYMFDFIRHDRSLKSMIYSGDYSRLRVSWTNDTLSSSQVSGIYRGLRELR